MRSKVLCKGGKPVRGDVSIHFECTSPPYHRASGTVDENGEFVLSFIEHGSGAPEGEHRIRFEPNAPYTEPTAEAALARTMPPRYREYRTSGLTRTITHGENELVIEVDRPSRQ